MSLKTLEHASAVLFELFYALHLDLRPGTVGKAIEARVARDCLARGFESALFGYKAFPGYCCVSRNQIAVHGIAGEWALDEGDIVTVDVAVKKDGFYADAAWTFVVGRPKEEARKLISAAWQCSLKAALSGLRGLHLGEITAMAHETSRRLGFAIPPACYGHGIGAELHASPRIPFDLSDPLFPTLSQTPIPANTALNIEPVLFRPSNPADRKLRRLPSGEMTTPRGEKSAQFEFTIWTGNRENDGRILSLPGIDPHDPKNETLPPFF